MASKQHKESFRDIRQAEKEAQRMRDAVRLKEGADPVKIQKKNSAFKKNIFKNAPIKNFGKVVAI